MKQQIAENLAPAARALAKNILPLKEPTEDLRKSVARWIEFRGWTHQIAGRENFSRAVRALATARLNQKGLVISGDVGTGKTSLLKSIRYFDQRPLKFINLRNPRDLAWLDAEQYPDFVREHCADVNIVLDDVGAEPLLNDYGKRYEPVMDFIYTYLSLGTGHLFITSNLYLEPPPHITDENEAMRHTFDYRYGMRFDLVKEHVVFTTFAPLAGSLRQATIIQ